MNINDYQDFTKKTAKYPEERALEYLTLGLTGEAGEVAEKVKKLIRDEGYSSIDDLTPDQKNSILLELGDILWYTSRLADELGYNMDYLLLTNKAKLESRKARNVISGSGDHR